LRCTPASDRAFGDIPLELAWTAALRRDTELEPAEAIPGVDGALVHEVAGPTGEPYDCVLFRWLPGRQLGARPTLQNLHRLGVLSARLHDHAATFRPPSDLRVRTLHELIGRGEREVLFTHDIPLFVPSARRVVFERVAERFRQEIDALYAEPAGRRVIHADLTVENVLVHRDQLRPLDFYETIWGYPIQDVALTLYDLRFFADCRPHGYTALRDAFVDGYMSRLPWPEQHSGQIDALVAGRRLRQANWVLLHETATFAAQPESFPAPAEVAGFFARLETEFHAFLEA
jgi:Ser/Thr protein kinase RdoA (MazF antagonist)